MRARNLGATDTGFCQVDDSLKAFVSGRSAAMTQISIRIGGLSATENPFDFLQEGTDGESG